MKLPKLSIIIPVYNAEKYIGRCLDSILSQSFSDFEIILVNDGSKDSTQVICENYAKRDLRIKLVSKSNGGVSSARNKGLEISKGEWILFVDADDELLPETLECMINATDESTDLIVGDYITTQGDNLPEIDPIIMQESIDSKEFLFARTFGRYGGYLWNKLFRKSVIDGNLLQFDEKIIYNEDRLFIFEYLSISSGKSKFINNKVYRYYCNIGGAMSSIEGPNYGKFETDLDAFIKMLQISRTCYSGNLSKIIERGVYDSYLWNKKLVTKYGSNSSQSQLRLRNKLFSSLSITTVYKLWIRSNLSRIKHLLLQQFKTTK